MLAFDYVDRPMVLACSYVTSVIFVKAEEQLHTLNKLASTIQVPVAQRSAPTPAAAAAAAGHGSRYPRPVRLERPKPAAVPQPAQQSQEVVVVDSSEEEEENVEEEEEEMTEVSDGHSYWLSIIVSVEML